MINNENYNDSTHDQPLNTLRDVIVSYISDQLASALKREVRKKLRNLTFEDKVVVAATVGAGICVGGYYLYKKSQNKADPYNLQSWQNAI